MLCVCPHTLCLSMFIQINIYLAAYEFTNEKQSLYLAEASIKQIWLHSESCCHTLIQNKACYTLESKAEI